MITKAIIKNKDSNSNKYEIRIPLFESAGQTWEYVVKATLSYQPGNLDAYKPGDIVYISFENNDLARPVILGKLYQGNEDTPSNFSNNAKLNVTESAVLPIDTKLADLSFQEVYNALKNNKTNENKLEQIEQDIIRIFDLINQGGIGPGGDSHISATDTVIDW